MHTHMHTHMQMQMQMHMHMHMHMHSYHAFFKEQDDLKTGVTEMFVAVIHELTSVEHDIMQYFYRDKQLNINPKDLRMLCDNHTQVKVKAALVKMLNNNRLLFPLKRYLKDYEKFGQMFEKLQALASGRYVCVSVGEG